MSDLVSIENLMQLKEIMEDEFSLLVDTFSQDSSELLLKIESSYDERNFNQLCVASHTLKGSSSNMYALGFSELCKQIEDKSKQADITGLKDLIHKLKEAHPKVIEIIRSC